MRIDVVTIFPDYFAPLALSLPGKAQERGLLDVEVHDLRQWTHDRHHTTDDAPYGGGAGMVMRPEPWGEALDVLLPADRPAPTVVVPTPSGVTFTQALARDLSVRPHLLFTCGRYEGIDQRVIDHAGSRAEVLEVSLGDYVLNGGEVAALAMIEAIVRLLPGFMGNPASLIEESHEDGLLEYPVYTRPPTWRDLDVPAVLLGGNHAAVDAWRREQALRRTAERRPDLVHRSATLTGEDLAAVMRPAVPADAGALLTLQRACWLQEQEANPGVPIPPLTEELATVSEWIGSWTVRVAVVEGRLVAAVRARRVGDLWDIGRLMVAPDLQGRGLGRSLLAYAEGLAPPGVTTYELFTGAGSERNLRSYRRAGYRPAGDAGPGTVRLTKRSRG